MIHRIIFFVLGVLVLSVLFFTVAFHSVFFYGHDEMRGERAALSAIQITRQEEQVHFDDAKTTKESHEMNTESRQTRQTRELMPYLTENK